MLRYLVHFALTLIGTLTLSAQGTHPVLRHYGAKEGLPSSEVYEVLQDREGYIWVSTDNGVCRFNGYEFETLGIEQGLTDPVVFYLFEDHRGWIWMYSFQDKVFIYKDGTITEFVHSDLIHSSRATPTSKGLGWIYVDEKGDFYASVVENGIIKIEANGNCTDLTEDVPRGYALWTHEGKRFYTYKSHTLFTYTVDEAVYGSLQDRSIPLTILKNDSTDVIKINPYWVYDGRAVLFHQNEPVQSAEPEVLMQFADRLELIDVENGNTLQRIPYQQGTITSLLESSKMPFLYLGHNFGEKGLAVFDRAHFRRDLSILSESALQLLPGKSITHLLEDRQGGIWIGTLDDGLYYIINPELLLGYFVDPELRNPRAITSGNGDTVWTRVQQHRIYSLSKDKKTALIPQGPQYGNSNQLYFDNNRSRLWASGLLKCWNGTDWIFLNERGFVKEDENQDDHYISIKIEPSYHSPDQMWCFGTTNFYRVDLHGTTPRVTDNFYLDPPQRVFSVLETRRGAVFVAGMQGVYEFFPETGQSQKIEHHPALSNRIEDLVELEDGTLVIGTKGGGVLFWNADTTIQITQADGLNSDYIEKLHVDSLHQIWVGTNYGLNRIQQGPGASFRISSLSLADGMPSNEITDITSQGHDLWVATVEGVFHYPIDAELENSPVPPVIEEVKVNGVGQPIEKLGQLQWFEDNIRIAVASLDYPQQGKITYRYRFSDREQWQTTQSRTIEVARLSPGDYDFEIQAQGRDRTWSPSINLQLRLQNPFWMSLWFWLLLLAALIIGIIAYYNRNLRRQAEQQRQEKQLLQLESEITALRQQAYRAQMNPHFVYNCLTAIQAYMLSDAADQLQASDFLAKFALLTRQALEASRNKKISLADDIKMLENYIQLEQFRFGNQFTYKIELDSSLPIHDIAIPALLVQPYVENAVLHGLSGLSYPGELSIEYTKSGSYVLIVIRDNGLGIYQHQAQQRERPGRRKHQSAGTEIARQRIEGTKLGDLVGSVTIDEITIGEQIKGTRISVKIPLDW